jgi:hypothetical protein
VTSNPAGDAVVLAFADAVPPAASLWPLTDATVRIRQGATLIAEHLYPNILKGAEASVDFRYRRGFEAALYPLPADDLQPGVATGTYTARQFADVPTFQPWGANGAGRIVRAGLERSNAPLERLSIELAVAQRMYDGIAGVLKTRDHLSQSLFNLIR